MANGRASRTTPNAPESESPVLTLRGVSYAYPTRSGPLEAVAPLDLTIGRGEFVCIVGPSGCGKTTLLRLMAGFISPGTGTIFDTGDVVRGPDWRRGMVFQQPQLYPWLTVQQNVEFGPRARNIPRVQRRQIAERYLRMVKLWEFRDHRTYELSGGMQQRVAVARALANEPHTLLMDEPLGALDALTREHMQDELLSIWRDTRRTVVLVTHSVEEAVYLSTRILVSSQRPARVLADLDVPFSRRETADDENARSIKADPEFVAFREDVLRYVWT